MKLKDLLKDAYKEDMTLEEIESALEGIKLPVDQTADVDRLKNQLSKANSEASDYKKQLKAKMTEDEQIKAQEQEEREKLQDAYNKLLHESQVAKNKAKLLALGYEESLADDTAEALVSGDTAKVFENQAKHQESLTKKIKAETLINTPKPITGNPGNGMTLKQFRSMDAKARLEYSQNNPTEYEALYATENNSNGDNK